MHLDTGALALGALPDDERPAIEEHIEGCDSCREELAGFRETVVRLAAVAAETPPATLRRTVLAAIAVTPQLPPARPSPPRDATAAAPKVHGTTAEAGVDGPSPGAVGGTVRPLRPWYRRPAGWIAAAAAAVVIGGGVVAINQFREPEPLAQTPEQCVAAAADRTEVTPAAGGGGVVYAPSCAAVTVDISGLPALPADRTYQLWALSEEQTAAPRSLGVLPQAATGQPQTVTESTRPGENAVAITAEPAGGSASPTLPIIWTAELTS